MTSAELETSRWTKETLRCRTLRCDFVQPICVECLRFWLSVGGFRWSSNLSSRILSSLNFELCSSVAPAGLSHTREWKYPYLRSSVLSQSFYLYRLRPLHNENVKPENSGMCREKITKNDSFRGPLPSSELRGTCPIVPSSGGNAHTYF